MCTILSLCLVACLPNRWQIASSGRCLQTKARDWTTSRNSKPPFPDIFDAIVFEIEVSQRWALLQRSCETVCSFFSYVIAAEIEMSQRWTLCQHSCKPRCSVCSDPKTMEIEVSWLCTLPLHFCKALCACGMDALAHLDLTKTSVCGLNLLLVYEALSY